MYKGAAERLLSKPMTYLFSEFSWMANQQHMCAAINLTFWPDPGMHQLQLFNLVAAYSNKFMLGKVCSYSNKTNLIVTSHLNAVSLFQSCVQSVRVKYSEL